MHIVFPLFQCIAKKQGRSFLVKYSTKMTNHMSLSIYNLLRELFLKSQMIQEEGLLRGASRCILFCFSPTTNYSRDLIILECVCCLKVCRFLPSPREVLICRPALHTIEPRRNFLLTFSSLTKEGMGTADYQDDEISFSLRTDYHQSSN